VVDTGVLTVDGAPSRALAQTVTVAASAAVVAARLGQPDLTLLFAGTSAAFFTRWWVFVRPGTCGARSSTVRR